MSPSSKVARTLTSDRHGRVGPWSRLSGRAVDGRKRGEIALHEADQLHRGLGPLGLSGLQVAQQPVVLILYGGWDRCGSGDGGGRADQREAQRQHGERPVRPSHGVLLGRRQELT
jgi:hypothetical protein